MKEAVHFVPPSSSRTPELREDPRPDEAAEDFGCPLGEDDQGHEGAEGNGREKQGVGAGGEKVRDVSADHPRFPSDHVVNTPIDRVRDREGDTTRRSDPAGIWVENKSDQCPGPDECSHLREQVPTGPKILQFVPNDEV